MILFVINLHFIINSKVLFSFINRNRIMSSHQIVESDTTETNNSNMAESYQIVSSSTDDISLKVTGNIK